MLKLPQALDWKRLSFIGNRVTWEAKTYERYRDQPVVQPDQAASGTTWNCLPFEAVQIDKFPTRGGMYAFTYTISCLGFPEQDVVMYVGEAQNLRNRLDRHLKTSREGSENTNSIRTLDRDVDRLRYLFSTFKGLTVHYCPMDLTQKDRRELERNLISLLDPPFNVIHKPAPRGEPIVRRKRFLAKAGNTAPAFAN